MWTAVILFSLASIVTQSFGGLLVLRELPTEDSLRNLTCISEDDGSALIWNHIYTTDASKTKREDFPDFEPQKGRSENITDCVIWNATKCHAHWGGINGWKVANSREKPMAPILDFRWEGLKEYFYKNDVSESSYEYVGQVTESHGSAVFSVRGNQNVYIFLCVNRNPEQGPCFWIVLGGYEGTKCIIRFCDNGTPPEEEDLGPESCANITVVKNRRENNVLDYYEWRTFRLAWNGDRKTIQVFKDSDPENKPFLEGKAERWASASHVFIRCDKHTRVRFHFYEYFRAEKNNSILSTGEFDHYGNNVCVDLLVGLCPKCKLAVALTNGQQNIDIGIIDGHENATHNGLLTWRFVKLNKSLQNVDLNRVKLKIRAILDKDGGEGQWAIDNFRLCNPTSKIRKSTITTPPEFLNSALQLKCQKLSYGEYALVDSVSPETIKTRNNPETQQYTELIESCGSSCKNFGKDWRVCSPIGCTCSRGFDGILCGTECKNGSYGYNCGEECGSCQSGSCDKKTGFCEAGCSSDNLPPPLCKIDEPIVRNIADTTATILQRLELEADATVSLIVEIRAKIAGSWKSFNFTLTKSDIPSTYKVDIDELTVHTTYTAHTIVTVTQAERSIHLLSPGTSFTTTCFKNPDFILNSTENTLTVTMKGPEECASGTTSDYNVVINDLADNSRQPRQLGFKFSVYVNRLMPYTEYQVTISNKTTRDILYSRKIYTLESAPSPIQNLRAENSTETEIKIRWDPPLKKNGIIRKYTVSFMEVKLLGCSEVENQRFKKTPIIRVTNETMTEFTNLHPYAVYEAKVIAYTIKPGDPETERFTTLSSKIPTSNVSNLRLTGKNETLQWDEPANCTTITGPVEFFRLFFEGVSDSVRNWNTTKQTERKYFPLKKLGDLKSYTEYKVRVHVIRAWDLPGNRDFYQEITWWTPPDVPPAVRNLKIYDADSKENTISLRWLPPYPPDGEIEYYRMRGISGSETWSPEDFAASNENLKCEPKWQQFVCYKYLNVPQKTDLTIKVQAKNKNVDAFGSVKKVVFTAQTYNTKPSEPNVSPIIPLEFGIVILKWTSPTFSITKITRFDIEARIMSSQLLANPIGKKPITATHAVEPNQTEYSIKLHLLGSTVYNVSVVTVNHRNITSVESYEQISVKGRIAFTDGEILQVEQNGTSIKLVAPAVLNATRETWVSVIVQGFTKCVMMNSRMFTSPIQQGQWIAAKYKVKDSRPKKLTIGADHDNGVSSNCSFESGETYRIFLEAKDSYSMTEAKLKPTSITIIVVDEEPQTADLTWLIILLTLAICALIAFVGYRKRGILLKMGRKSSNTESLIAPWNQLTRLTPSPCSKNNQTSCQENASNVVPYDAHSCPVKIEEFENYIKEALASGLLVSQFKLFEGGLTKACQYGKLPENNQKNRYKDRVAYDDTRVVLKKIHGDRHSDYINASYIQGYKKGKGYIATQGPKPNTVDDFWRMIWQEDVRVICMLANIVENGKIKCHQYWPEVRCNVEYGNILVSNTGHEVFVDYTFRTFVLSLGKDRRVVTHLHYTGWPDHGVPMYVQSLLPYLKKLQDTTTENSPVVVHCSAGVGRTGTIILCDISLNRAKEEGIVDLPAEVKKMRQNRANMVDNAQQYLLAHLVIAEYLVSAQTVILCNSSLQEKIEDLRRELPSHVERLKDTVWQDRALHSFGSPENLVPGNVMGDGGSMLVPISSDLPLVEHSPRSANQSKYLTIIVVDGMKMKNQYIASSLPSPANWPDLWRRITDERVELLIILQSPDPNDPTCCSVLPNDLTPDPVQQIQVEPKTGEDDEVKDFPIDRLVLKGEGAEPQPVTVLTCTGWGCGGEGKPPPASTLVSLWRASEKISRKEGPTFVLCRDGLTGCGLYLALSFLLERMAVAGECDVISAVRAVRRYKPEFVESMEQFEYLYDAAVEYDKCFQTYANFS